MPTFTGVTRSSFITQFPGPEGRRGGKKRTNGLRTVFGGNRVRLFVCWSAERFRSNLRKNLLLAAAAAVVVVDDEIVVVVIVDADVAVWENTGDIIFDVQLSKNVD